MAPPSHGPPWYYQEGKRSITQDETETPSSPGYDHSKWALATGEPAPDLRLALMFPSPFPEMLFPVHTAAS